MQAYQNLKEKLIVQHENTSIRKICLKNHYFNYIFYLEGTVQQVNTKHILRIFHMTHKDNFDGMTAQRTLF